MIDARSKPPGTESDTFLKMKGRTEIKREGTP